MKTKGRERTENICLMMYPFMTLENETEITYSEMQPDGRVKVYIETPDEKYCFRHATCYLPDYTWEEIYHYSNEEIQRFRDIIKSSSHLIIELSKDGWKEKNKMSQEALKEIQSMFADDKKWDSEEYMLADMAEFRRERMSS